MAFDINDINSKESESTVITTLLYHPDYIFLAEELLPNHFSINSNKCIYAAIQGLVREGISNIDPLNILQYLDSNEATKKLSKEIDLRMLTELFDNSQYMARHTAEEYKLAAKNVLNASFRRDAYRKLGECQKLCLRGDIDDTQQRIYHEIDSIMSEYSTASEVPAYADVIDECWGETLRRQKDGVAGIPFKFPTLNEFATIEPGELFIFAGAAKQGKSMMLLNCAVDLLKQDLSVLYIDSELNTRLFTERILSHLTGIEFKRLRAGNYSNEEQSLIDKAIAWMKTRKFVHIYMPMFDEQSICTTVKKVYHTIGVDCLIVDYFKSSSDGDAFNSYQELGRFTD